MTIEKVVSNGFCIGCGTCRAVNPDISIDFNTFGDLTASLPPVAANAMREADGVCPFSDSAPSEDAIADAIFAQHGFKKHDDIGYYHSLYAAYAPATRASGSSGGMVTWLLETLLSKGIVDRVIHVAPAETNDATGRFFKFRVSDSADSIASGATSFYYPVSYDEVVDFIATTPGRYAITGVPCFQKALRQLRAISPVFEERIAIQVGIVCGQMKSADYLRYLQKMAGVDDSETVSSACFRRKVDGYPANDYAFEVSSVAADGTAVRRRIMNSAIGVNWGMGYFKPLACDYCDDVLAETADIAAMDAWLPKYVKDGAGWSLLVVRNQGLATLLRSSAENGELVLDAVSEENIADSQRGGLNHRKGMLGYRLWLRRNAWVPRKRTVSNNRYPLILRLEQRFRAFLREQSRLVFRSCADQKTGEFQRRMAAYEFAYKILMRIKARLN